MTTNVTLVLPSAQYDEVEELLKTDAPIPNMGNYEYELLGCLPVNSDGLEVDVKLCNSQNGPFLDIILFNDGYEQAFGEPEYSLSGSTTFEYVGGEIVVSIERGE